MMVQGPWQIDELAGHLVPHDHPRGSRETAVVDVLAAAADVRRHDPQNGAVIALSAPRADQFWKLYTLNLELARSDKHYGTIVCHGVSLPVGSNSWLMCNYRAWYGSIVG
jgi:hypothetical protein